MTPRPEPDIQARTVVGFCAAYGVGRTTAYALIKAGKLRAVTATGDRTLIVEASAREWFEALPAIVPASKMRILANASKHKRAADRANPMLDNGKMSAGERRRTS